MQAKEHLVTTDDLQKWTGYTQIKRVLSFLQQNNIPFWIAGGKPITTMEAVNSMLVRNKPANDEEFDFG